MLSTKSIPEIVSIKTPLKIEFLLVNKAQPALPVSVSPFTWGSLYL
jgi:hypothetical protein